LAGDRDSFEHSRVNLCQTAIIAEMQPQRRRDTLNIRDLINDEANLPTGAALLRPTVE